MENRLLLDPRFGEEIKLIKRYMKLAYLLGLIIISKIWSTTTFFALRLDNSKHMEVYEFNISQRRKIIQTIANKRIETIHETSFAFVGRPKSPNDRKTFVITFRYYTISEKGPKAGSLEELCKTPFAQSLEAFNNATFEISLLEKKIQVKKGYQEFAERINSAYFKFYKHPNSDPPSNSFSEIFFEKLFEKAIFQVPAGLNIQSTWNQSEEVHLLNEIVNFGTTSMVSKIHNDIWEIKTNGEFLKDVNIRPAEIVSMQGDYRGHVEYDHGIGFPRIIQNCLQMEGITNKAGLDLSISVFDTYTLKSSPFQSAHSP